MRTILIPTPTTTRFGAMTPRDQARFLNIARTAFGAALFLAPSLLGRPWIGDDADRPGTKAALRSMGVRDAALGIGALIALERDAPVRGWLEAGVLSDAGDALGALLGWRRLPAFGRLGVLVSASGAAVVGRQLSVALS